MKNYLFLLLAAAALLSSCAANRPLANGRIPHQRFEDARIRRQEPPKSHLR